MVYIRVRDNESPEEALKRFKHECEKNAILKEIKKREFYISPSLEKKIRRQELKRKLRKINSTNKK
ncbi:MAG: 30S ribosomal protein S21 [Elusimicrobiales bacterium]|nr:30S ribosomal protein S21 [Elusimicrobiales bacterium]